MKAALGIDNYPDWTARALREKIAQKYGYAPEQVICGAGETEIISWIIRVFAAPGDSIAMFVPGFPIYHMAAENEGRVPVYVGMRPASISIWTFLGDDRPRMYASSS